MNVLFSYDTMNIPDAMKEPYGAVQAIAAVLIIVLFILEIFRHIQKATLNTTTSQPLNLLPLIYKLILVFVCLAWYKYIFMKIVALSELIAMALCDASKISDLINLVFNESNIYVDKAMGGGTTGKVFGMLGAIYSMLNPKILILGILSVIVAIAEPVLLTLRYWLLCVLYVFGPFTFASYIFKPTTSLLKGWFLNVFQISFWIVFLRIIELVFISFNIESLATNGHMADILPWIAVCVIFIGMIICVPIITSKILSGQNLGEMASVLTAAGAIIPAKWGMAAGKVAGIGKNVITNSAGYAGGKASVAGKYIGSKFKKGPGSDKSAPRR